MGKSFALKLYDSSKRILVLDCKNEQEAIAVMDLLTIKKPGILLGYDPKILDLWNASPDNFIKAHS